MKYRTVLLAGFLLVAFLAVPSVAAESSRPSWNGSEFEVGNVRELQWMTQDPDNGYLLVSDIDASSTSGWNGGKGFKPIGSTGGKFEGNFDGGHHLIEGLYIDRDSDNVGLFGVIGLEGVVENLGLEGVDVAGGEYSVGALSGNSGGTIRNCYSTGEVTGGSYKIGGLVGRLENGVIGTSFSSCSVSGPREAIGGLVGDLEGGSIGNCYASGSVTGDTGVGGLVGANYGGKVTNCYAIGNVSGDAGLGGLLGFTEEGTYGTVEDSFWDVERTGMTSSSGGTGKTSGEMTDVRTFTYPARSSGLSSPWDLSNDPYDDQGDRDLWGINFENNGGYPFLEWQEGFVHNIKPNLPDNLLPSGRVLEEVQTLSAKVSDNDGDRMNVYFWNASDESLLDNVWSGSGERANILWEGLSEGGTYSFAVGSRDNKGAWSENSPVGTFTVNTPPNKPEDLEPTGVIWATSVELTALVSDNESDRLTVWFYDGSDNSLIGSDRVRSGGTANVTWTGLPEGESSYFAKAGDNWENSEPTSERSFLVSLDNNPTISQVTPENEIIDRKVDEPGSGADDALTARVKISDRNGWEDVEGLWAWVRDNSDEVLVENARVLENEVLDNWTIEFTYSFDPDNDTSSLGVYDLRFLSRDGSGRRDNYSWSPDFMVDDISVTAVLEGIRLENLVVRGSGSRLSGENLELTEGWVLDNGGGATELFSEEFTVTHGLSSGESYVLHAFLREGPVDGVSEFKNVSMPLVRAETPQVIDAVSSRIVMSYDTGSYENADLWFEWRRRGESWNTTDVINLSGSGTVEENLTSLEDNSVYDFYAVMRENFVERSERISFRTDYPRVSIGSVEDVTSRSAKLNGIVDLRGKDSVELYAQYKVEGRISWAEESVGATGSGERSYTLTGLRPNTDYEFRWGIVGIDYHSDVANFTTLPVSADLKEMDIRIRTGVMVSGDFEEREVFSPENKVHVRVSLTSENGNVTGADVRVNWSLRGDDWVVGIEENEPGVYSGSFDLPDGISGGKYSLDARAEADGFEDSYGQGSFTVESMGGGSGLDWWVYVVVVVIVLMVSFLFLRMRRV